ncbi:Hypothetical predicted protein, partial [Olea europaea subsp. europaea]
MVSWLMASLVVLIVAVVLVWGDVRSLKWPSTGGQFGAGHVQGGHHRVWRGARVVARARNRRVRAHAVLLLLLHLTRVLRVMMRALLAAIRAELPIARAPVREPNLLVV